MLRLFQVEWCPYCARVRSKMCDLGLTYANVNVPRDKSQRAELIEVSGQAGVPTLVTEDGHVIADDDDAIVEYLDRHYAR